MGFLDIDVGFADKNYKSTDLQQFSYYSGSQISVWFSDIWVEDIMSIRFSYNQEKRPIYGYASQYFDAVAKGQVIIQGDFTINFRERGYISYIVNSIKQLEQDIKAGQSKQQSEVVWTQAKSLISQHLRRGTFGPTTIAEIQELGNSEDFWGNVELYEKIIWGEGEEGEKIYPGTPDIIQQNNLPKGFNIMITYGDIGAMEPQTLHDITNSTTKSLIGVHLVGSSQVITHGGEPVQETYTFLARDIDKYIGTTY